MVGDLVNRGPRSLEVLRWARDLEVELGDRLVMVLGNHDVHLLALAAALGKPHHRESLAAVLEASDGTEILEWLRCRPLLHHSGEYILVHAGLLPQWDAATAARLARRVEAVLRRPDGLRLLLGLSSPDEPQIDTREEARVFRVLTRARMLKANGELCGHTGPPESAPADCRAWFDMPGRKSRDQVVVAGHWAALGRRLRPNLLALDSGCVYGGALTAVRLEDRRVFECPNRD